MSSRSDGDVLYQASNVVEKRVPAAVSAEDGYTLVADGSTGDGVWTDATTVFGAWAAGVLTTRGDLLAVNSTPEVVRLALGSANTVLRSDGSDTVWGQVVGGDIADTTIPGGKLENGAVDTTQIADDAVSLAKLAAGTDGELITWDANGDPTALGVGTSGQVLATQGAGAVPVWSNLITSLTSANPGSITLTEPVTGTTLIVKFGKVASLGANSETTVTFATAFPTAIIGSWVSHVLNANDDQSSYVKTESTTAILIRNENGSEVAVNWLALGN